MDAALLKGRVALVTGAGRNIGRAIALALADAGAQVAVNVRASRHEGQAVVDDIVARGGDALLVLADVTQRAQVDAMIAAIAQRFGRLDIVVNNAAIRLEAPFDELRYADWQAAQAVCVDGAFHCTQSAMPHLRGSNAGSVINIGGMTAHTGAAKRAHVVSAKAALGGLTGAGARTGRLGDHRQLRLAGADRHGALNHERERTADAPCASSSAARAARPRRRGGPSRGVAGGPGRALRARLDVARQRRRLPRRMRPAPTERRVSGPASRARMLYPAFPIESQEGAK